MRNGSKDWHSKCYLTGGEPLLHASVRELLQALGQLPDIRIEIETNGSIDLTPFQDLVPRPSFTMDYKLPGSGMEAAMCLDNFALLQQTDTVKFVAGSQEDLERALELIQRYRLPQRCHVYLSPVFGKIDPADMVEFMKQHRLNAVRLQLQMHKFIWDPNQKEFNKNGDRYGSNRTACAWNFRSTGEDPQREGLLETPQRVAKMYEEVFAGMAYSNHELAQMFGKTFEAPPKSGVESVVAVKDISVFSFCEHHMALMYDMHVNVAYVPKDRVIGLSKIARICDMAAKRLQIQERLGQDIAEIIMGSHWFPRCGRCHYGYTQLHDSTRNSECSGKNHDHYFCGRFQTEAALQNRILEKE